MKTKWGNAVIVKVNPEFDHANTKSVNWDEVSEDYRTSYALEHLPGHIDYIWEDDVGFPPKHAWYDESEFVFVAPSAARKVMEAAS